MSTKSMDLDELLQTLGSFGRYQIINYMLISVPIIFSSMFAVAYAFTAGEVNYRCRIPECDLHDAKYYPVPEWITHSTGWETYGGESVPRRCERYEPSFSNFTWKQTEQNNSTCPVELFSNRLVRCNGFVYDENKKTIANEWEIACDDQWKLSFVGTINNIGQFVGLPLAGVVSDRMGRKTTLILTTVLSGVLGVARSFASSFTSFIALESLEPMFGSGLYNSAFVLCMELMGPDYRVLGGMLVSIFYAIGEALLAAFAWALKDWRLLLRVMYSPAILVFTYYWFIPESVRWLMARGRTEDARRIIQKVASVNRAPLPDHLLNDFLHGRRESRPSNNQQPRSKPDTENKHTEIDASPNLWTSIKEALRSRILLFRLLNCSFCWLANTFVYYGLSLFSVTIGGNEYLNFILVSLIEIPAYILMYFVADRFGRRSTLAGSLLFSGLSCAAFIFIPKEEDGWVRMLPYLSGKFAITIAFSLIFIYTAELFPTAIRHSLLGVCSMVGRFGSVMAPQTTLLATVMPSLPLIMFSVMTLISGALALLLPETVNLKLPDTVAEAEELGCKTRSETPTTTQVQNTVPA